MYLCFQRSDSEVPPKGEEHCRFLFLIVHRIGIGRSRGQVLQSGGFAQSTRNMPSPQGFKLFSSLAISLGNIFYCVLLRRVHIFLWCFSTIHESVVPSCRTLAWFRLDIWHVHFDSLFSCIHKQLLLKILSTKESLNSQ